MNPSPAPPLYSVVIPVFNSEKVVGGTVDSVAAFFESHGFRYEIILVNDGSQDGSWDVIRSKAQANRNITAINLLRNYGQHNANLCGLRNAKGDFVVTMDDDGQNPPGEILHLIQKAGEGYDLVFGRFEVKAAPFLRTLGSKVVGMLNRRIFGQPKDLTATNFRIIRRDVVERITESRTSFPYITGLALINSNKRANVTVKHEPRTVGRSNYSVFRIAALVMTILFSYSSFPLRFLAGVGVLISAVSFLIGMVFLGLGLFQKVQVAGWTTVVVLLSFLNGTTILLVSMLGEYLVRVLNQTSNTKTYNVIDIVQSDR